MKKRYRSIYHFLKGSSMAIRRRQTKAFSRRPLEAIMPHPTDKAKPFPTYLAAEGLFHSAVDPTNLITSGPCFFLRLSKDSV